MVVKTKTWRIGEYATYGIWKLEVKDASISAIGIDWGSKKERERADFPIPKKFGGLRKSDFNELRSYLEGNSTSYYADKMMQWVFAVLGITDGW